MINLQTLVLSDFMCIESAEIDFTDNYLTIFYGDNGQGKSAVMEAIALCFTERRRGDSYKDFIRHGAAAASICLTATIQGKPIVFNINIVDKKGSTPFQRSIVYEEKPYTNSECTALLQSFDTEYLQHIMFSMQDEGNITDLKPAERARLLKRILNFEFTSQVESLDTLINQSTQTITILQTRTEMLTSREFKYQELREALDPDVKKRIQQEIDQDSVLLANLEREKQLQAETSQRLESLRIQYLEAATKKKSIEKDLDLQRVSMARLTAEINNQKATIDAQPEAEVLELSLNEKREELEIVQHLINEEKQFLTASAPNLDGIKTRVLELTSHIEAHKQGKCSKCGQLAPQDKVPELEKLFEQVSSKLKLIAEKREHSADAISMGERNANRLTAEITSLQREITSSKSLRSQYSNLLKSTQENLDHAQASINLRTEMLTSLDKSLVELKGQIDELSTKVFDSSRYSQLVASIAKKKEQLQADEVVRNVNATIEAHNKEILEAEEKNKQELAELSKQQNELFTNIATYREAKKILEIELPNYVIVKACSKLEKHINTFIANVMPNMVVRLFQSRSGVEFFYSPIGMPDELDDWTSTKMASGFERELLAAAWRVALARAYNLQILLLDEIDSAANPVSSEKMFREIANLAGFNQLIIITHKPEVVDILQQENTRVVAYKVVSGAFYKQEY